MIRKFIVLIVSTCLIFYNPIVYASALPDWKVTKVLSQGATTVLDAFSNAKAANDSRFKFPTAANDPVYSRVSVPAKPSALSKAYRLSGPTLAFSAAVAAILGAVDYVLDPDNNRVTYKTRGELVLYTKCTDTYTTACTPAGQSNQDYLVSESEAKAAFTDYAQAQIDSKNYYFVDLHEPVYNNRITANPPLYSFTQNYDYRTGETGNLNIAGESKVYYYVGELKDAHLSYDDIAAKVINDANAGSSDAQADTAHAANPENHTDADYGYNINELEDALEAVASPDPDTIGNPQPNPEPEPDPEPNPETDPDAGPDSDISKICEVLPIFCTAAQEVLKIGASVKEIAKTLKDALDAPEQNFDNPELEPALPEELPTVTPITFSTPSACPANPKINFSLGRVPASVEIPVHLVCYVAELIRPFVIAGGYLTGAAILFRGRE